MAATASSSSSSTRLSKEEIQSAFSFLDGDKNGQITMTNLRKRLGVFFPDMTSKEYRFLMGNRKEITLEDMNEFLQDTEFTDPEFDPVLEAFKTYDSKQHGSIKKERLKEIFATYQMNEADLKEEELDAILNLADVDGDGQVTLEDFRAMIKTQQAQELLENENAAVVSSSVVPETSTV